MYGAVTCLAAPPTPKWCSYGFDQGDKPAELVFFRGNPELRLQGKTVRLAEEHGIWEETVTFATISYWTEGIEYRNQRIVIYLDRVFWPCEKM